MIKGMMTFVGENDRRVPLDAAGAAFVMESDVLTWLHKQPEILKVTGSRFFGMPRRDSDFDIVFMGKGYGEAAYAFQDKIRKRWPNCVTLQAYHEDMEEATGMDDDLFHVIRIKDGVIDESKGTSVDIQFVRRPKLRIMVRDLIKKNMFYGWYRLKDKKMAGAIWSFATRVVAKSFKYKYLTLEM